MTLKYSVGDEVRITEDVESLTSIHIPEREAERVAGEVGRVLSATSVLANLPYEVSVPRKDGSEEDPWSYREEFLRPANETTSDGETTPEPDAPDPVAELSAFKARVVEVATRYATAHNMCSVIDDALGELGLERAGTRYTFTVTLDVPAVAYVDTLRADMHREIIGRIESDDDWFGVSLVRPNDSRYAIAVEATPVE